MKPLDAFRILAYFAVFFVQYAFAQEPQRYEYVFPKPKSQFVSRETNVIIRPGKNIDPTSLNGSSLFNVVGSRSGSHEGQTVLSDDHKTIVFNPRKPFVDDERVAVKVLDGLRYLDGRNIGGTSFEFATSAGIVLPNHVETTNALPGPGAAAILAAERSGMTAVDTLPLDFPAIKIDTLNNPAPGEVFIAPFIGPGLPATNANYLVILDNSGKPLAYKRIGLQINPFPYMFKVEPNGVYSYIERTLTSTTIKIVDTSFNVVDTYPKGNPATSSHADFHLLPNGHALVLYFDYKIIDMSKIVRGGNPAASVMGTLVQEFDLSKNVVFQWSSFDYQPITDTYEDTLAATIDYSHANNVELDNDGNILLSNRHMSEITKIDRNTGEIIWRLGGKRNQFTFLNEHPENSPFYFSYQHHIKRLPNGNVTLFDNGNQRKLQYSRAIEYRLDEVNKTATLVWEYRHVPDIYASAQGSVQRLPNGNTLIGWGDAGIQGKPSVTEVHPDKSLAFELTLPKGNRSMHAYRLPWKSGRPVGTYTRYELLEGNTYPPYSDTSAAGRIGVRMKFNVLSPFFYNSATVQKFAEAPFRPQFAGRSAWMASHRVTISQLGMVTINVDLSFDVAQLAGIPAPNLVTVYQRDTAGSGYFSALPTTHNPARNEIVANTSKFGEFIFCWNDTDSLASSPAMITPANRDSLNQLLPVSFSWNPRGYGTGYHLQVASDSLFRSLVLNDSLLKAASDTLKSVTPKATYYWRIRARNFAQTSNWSHVWSFTTTVPYISVSSPNGLLVWQRGFQYFIRWISNLRDKVRIELFRGTSLLSMIKDSASTTGAYNWTIPSTITPDTSYRIRITSVADSTLFGMSAGSFSINSGSTGIVEKQSRVPVDFGLHQNYPNPFNPSTAIRYQIPIQTHVSLIVYDMLGREVSILVDAMQDPGYKTMQFDAGSLASGMYFYRLKTDSFVQTRKLLLLK